MDYRLLGRSGFSVPVLSLGTATFGGSNDFFRKWGSSGIEEATRLVDMALDAGVNLFDTADGYSDGMAETILGAAIKGRTDKVLISTKAFFPTGPGPNDRGTSRQHLVQTLEGSLKRLGVDHVDLWQMHGFDALTPVEETLRLIDDMVSAGKVRYVGCSNFSGWHLMKSLAVSDRYGYPRYVAHQAYYSLLGREYEWELMPLGIDQGVGAVVWSPLAGGMLSGKLGRNRPAPAGSRAQAQGSLGPKPPDELIFTVVEALEAIALDLGRSVAQVALNWVLQRPTVSTIVFGARNAEQLRDNLGATSFTLTKEQIARLDQASDVPKVYPYWHQGGNPRNPFPV